MNVYMNGTMTPKTGRKTKQHGEGRNLEVSRMPSSSNLENTVV